MLLTRRCCCSQGIPTRDSVSLTRPPPPVRHRKGTRWNVRAQAGWPKVYRWSEGGSSMEVRGERSNSGFLRANCSHFRSDASLHDGVSDGMATSSLRAVCVPEYSSLCNMPACRGDLFALDLVSLLRCPWSNAHLWQFSHCACKQSHATIQGYG